MTVGYNAKPGGCGGFIVPDSKLESWKEKILEVVKGEKNPNACIITNDELIALAVDRSDLQSILHRDQAQRDEYSRMYKGKKKDA